MIFGSRVLEPAFASTAGLEHGERVLLFIYSWCYSILLHFVFDVDICVVYALAWKDIIEHNS